MKITPAITRVGVLCVLINFFSGIGNLIRGTFVTLHGGVA